MTGYGKVSVIMPNYNYEKYLSSAIESVLHQTYEDLELIIIDNCSEDNSVEIIEAWQQKDPRVVAIVNQVNQGAAESHNIAIRRMSGDYLALCDADDIWYPRKLEVQLAWLTANPRAGLVHSQAAIIDSDDRLTGRMFSELYSPNIPRKSGNVLVDILTTCYLCSSSTMIRRECVEFAGWFHYELKYLYDWPYWATIARKYEFEYVPEVLLSYRVHPKSTALDGSGYEIDRIKATETILETVPEILPEQKSFMLYIRGNSLSSMGRKDEARRSFLAALRASPMNWKAFARLMQTIASK